MFYYILLAATVLAFDRLSRLAAESHGLFLAGHSRRRGGRTRRWYQYLPLQDDRGVISAAMTSFAGVIYAFYYNNLFPEQVFNISQSILIILAPFVGGVGTLFGPILGAFMLETIAESMRTLLEWFGVDLPGTNQLFFGVVLLLVVIALPEGVWPWLCRRLGLTEQKP